MKNDNIRYEKITDSLRAIGTGCGDSKGTQDAVLARLSERKKIPLRIAVSAAVAAAAVTICAIPEIFRNDTGKYGQVNDLGKSVSESRESSSGRQKEPRLFSAYISSMAIRNAIAELSEKYTEEKRGND